MIKESKYGKNNFDRLEAAGLVAGADDTENQKAKAEARISRLRKLSRQVQKIEAYLTGLPTISKKRQLLRLDRAAQAFKDLRAEKLPTGSKRHIDACLNEVQSLREGIFVSGMPLVADEMELVKIGGAPAEFEAMAISASHRIERIMADSSSEGDSEEFYRKAADVIRNNDAESTKITPMTADEPFSLVRVPVVPTDGSLVAEKLPTLGFRSESLSGYPVIHNQLVIGINPKALAGHNPEEAERFATMSKALRAAGVTLEEVQRLQAREKAALKACIGLEDGSAALTEAQAKAGDASQAVSDFIGRAGVNLVEFQKLEQHLRRSHSALPAAIRAEADAMIASLSESKRVKLRLVCERPYSFRGGVWFWIMADRDLDQLAKASLSKRVSITKWGFAFN